MSFDVAALDDLLLGRGVKRGRHDLPREAVELLFERLAACGFVSTLVADVAIDVGVRLPAWLLRPPRIDFGIVFWELFTETRRRKLFGSEVRNAKGDWEIQIPSGSPEMVWVDPGHAERYDASRPVGMF